MVATHVYVCITYVYVCITHVYVCMVLHSYGLNVFVDGEGSHSHPVDSTGTCVMDQLQL